MALKIVETNIDVVTAARQRIINVFETAPKVYLNFSAGKDSACMCNLVYDEIINGTIDKNKLIVIFIDEEGLYPSMVKAAEHWRNKFGRIGVPFLWFCLPFKQVCVIDHLSSDESWITWEPGKEDVWMRQPPPYAIVRSPYLHYAGEMNYQTFCERAFSDGISIIGIRTSESLTRLKTIAERKNNTARNKSYPIYDWTDTDVWLYIKEHDVYFPEVYMHLYEGGVPKRNLRLCAFFGDRGVVGLRWIMQTDPDLWERIERRMPNAYLAMLYWDSEMFGRQTKTRTKLEAGQAEKDYKELLKDLLFWHPERYTIPRDTKKSFGGWRNLFKKIYAVADNKDFKRMYEAILYGDPKRREMRMIYVDVFGRYNKEIEAEVKARGGHLCAPGKLAVGGQNTAESE